jgi:hypothetical protein
MKDEVGLKLNSDALIRRALTISANRDQYFNDMIRKFKQKFPGLKIIYANDTMGAKLDPDHPNQDFILICKGKLVSKDPRRPPKSIVILDAPLIFTERSIAGWTMAVEQGNMDGYFSYMLDKALRIDESKFYEYITHMALLSTDPNDALYWKRIENTKKLTDELSELYSRYTPKKPTALKDKRGYQTPPGK